MIIESVVLLVTLSALAYWLHTKLHHGYWAERGIKTPSYPSVHPIGNSIFSCYDVLSGKVNFVEAARRQADEMRSEPVYGTYGPSGKPILVINNPDLCRDVLVKAFNHFGDRQAFQVPKNSLLLADRIAQKGMFLLKGNEWKDTRSTFTPIFTSGKIKGMSPIIERLTGQLVAAIESDIDGGRETDIKDRTGRFAMDSIATCAFGVDPMAQQANEESQFLHNAKEFFIRRPVDGLKFAAASIPFTQYLMTVFGIPTFKKSVMEFFYDVVKTTVEERVRKRNKGRNERRNDLVDLMVDAIQDELKTDDDVDQGQYDSDAKLTHKAKKTEFDLVQLTGVGLTFLVAGYDTTGTTMSIMCQILATRPDIHRKLQEEIDVAVRKNEGKALPYSTIQELEYLDMFLHETLRRHPQAGMLNRLCTLDYDLKVPGRAEPIKIKRGQEIFINAAGIHMDPRIYPDPDTIVPERFSKEEKAKRSPYSFLAFGQGPHNCIGMRFALLEAKIGMVTLLCRYNLVATPKTPRQICLDPTKFLGSCRDPIMVKMERRGGDKVLVE